MELKRKNPILLSVVYLLLSLQTVKTIEQEVQVDNCPKLMFPVRKILNHEGPAMEKINPFQSWEFGLYGYGNYSPADQELEYQMTNINSNWDDYSVPYGIKAWSTAPGRRSRRIYENMKDNLSDVDKESTSTSAWDNIKNASNGSGVLQRHSHSLQLHTLYGLFFVADIISIFLILGFVLVRNAIIDDEQQQQIQSLPSQLQNDVVPVSIFDNLYFYGGISSALGLVIFLIHLCTKNG